MSLPPVLGRRLRGWPLLALTVIWLSGSVPVSAGEEKSDRFKGIPLASALAKVQQRGVRILFSSELVRPDMIVREEPRGRLPQEILDELLAPHGLRWERGPSGAHLIVKAPGVVEAPSEPKRDSIEKDSKRAGSAASREPNPPHAYLEHVVVRADDPSWRMEAPSLRESLGPDDLQRTPEFSDDPLLAVARLPGVASTDGSGGLNVRGGASREAKIILDGLELYDPYHLKDRGGPISIIDSNNLGGVGLLNGGFPAEYGGHMSAVVELETSVPADAFEAGAAVSTDGARVASQGLFGERGRWLLSVRRGDPSRLLEAVRVDPAYRPPYVDFFARADYRPDESTTWSLHVLGADDEVEGGASDEAIETARERLRSQHTQRYAWMTFMRAVSPRLFSQTVLSAGQLRSDRYGSSPYVAEVQDRRSTEILGLKQDWLWQSGSHLVKWGADFKQLRARYTYTSIPTVADLPSFQTSTAAGPIEITSAPAGSDFGVYVADRLRLTSKLNVEAGFRWDRQTYTPDHDGALSPRVNAVYAIGARTAMRLGWGYFYQHQKIHQLQVEDGVQQFLPAERAEHRLISCEHQFEGGLLLRINAYQKRMSDLNPRFENVFDPFGFFPEAGGDRVVIVSESARAEGLELVVRSPESSTTNWWAAYGLARAEDQIDGNWVPRSWDQRHALTAGVGWRPSVSWDLMFAGGLHSGRPTTPVDGPRNSLRLPAYQRLDLQLSRSIALKASELRATVTVTDAFDGQQADCCLPDLSRLVTLGISWRF